ncbi:MAG: hypothetical protein IJZ57_07485 [Clostridia bacterium]|nr:hypothetical protein [Clostridia bacterium]
MKKTLVFPIFSLVTFIIGVITIALYAIVKVLQTMGTLLYFSGINTDTLYFTILCAGCMLVLASISVFLFKNFKHKWISVLISAILTVIIVFIMFFIRVWYISDIDYFEFTSDDGEHSIMIMENSFLHGGSGMVYEKTSDFTMKKVGNYSFNHVASPVNNNNFFLVWNEDNFELHFKGNRSGEYDVIIMEYVK